MIRAGEPYHREIYVGSVPGLSVGGDGMIFYDTALSGEDWSIWDAHNFGLCDPQYDNRGAAQYAAWIESHVVETGDFYRSRHSDGTVYYTFYKKRAATSDEILFLQTLIAFANWQNLAQKS